MKKSVIWLCVSLLCLVLCACAAGSQDTPTTPPTTEPIVETTTAPETTEPSTEVPRWTFSAEAMQPDGFGCAVEGADDSE